MKTLKNNIEDTYCSFDVCKLLQKKRCRIITEKSWCLLLEDYKGWDNREGDEIIFNKKGEIIFGDPSLLFHDFIDYKEYLAPTQVIAIEWLRVNFGIWIFVGIEPESGVYYPNIDVKAGKKYFDKFGDYETPQESTEAALLYVLKNLI